MFPDLSLSWTFSLAPCDLYLDSLQFGRTRTVSLAVSSFLWFRFHRQVLDNQSSYLGSAVAWSAQSRCHQARRGAARALRTFTHQPRALLLAARRSAAPGTQKYRGCRPAHRVLPHQFRDAARGSAGCRSCYLSKKAARSASSGFPLCQRCPLRVAGCPRERSLLVSPVAYLLVPWRLNGSFQDPFFPSWCGVAVPGMCENEKCFPTSFHLFTILLLLL